VSGLDKKGFEMIRKFVTNGGGYIGICAGAYLAAPRVEIPGKPQGLGIIDIQNIRKKGIGTRKIYLKEHPITKGLKGELIIRYQNGPEILIKGEAKEVARYENGSSAIVTASYGKGKVVIFSPHPEGSITQGIKPKPATLKLLKNSIEFCIRSNKQKMLKKLIIVSLLLFSILFFASAAFCLPAQDIEVITNEEYFPRIHQILREAKDSIQVMMFEACYYEKYPDSPSNILIPG